MFIHPQSTPRRWSSLNKLFALIAVLLIFSPSAFAEESIHTTANAADIAWLLVASALVLLMTPALALFYGGLVRRKNILNVLMMVMICVPIVSLLWVTLEYSLVFAHGLSWIGSLKNVLLNGTEAGTQTVLNGTALTIPSRLNVMYQLMFAIITPALICGAVVERMKFSAYALFVALWSLLVYAPIAHMVWGDGGMLASLGTLDFAGGLVVHTSSGVSALILAIMLGKRRLKQGEPALRPHNLPMTLIGAALLWFGWFGFNAGSAGGANDLAVNAFMTTHLAAATAAFAWIGIEWLTTRKPTTIGFVSGAVIGLVAITPGAGYVGFLSAIFIGAMASVAGYYATRIKGLLKADDTLDVFAVHGIGGLWGTIAVGLFADPAINKAGRGLIFGSVSLLGSQLFAALVTVVLSVVGTVVIVKIVHALVGVRSSESEEETGLDQTIHGEDGYDQTAFVG